jgi:hypothetical protein
MPATLPGRVSPDQEQEMKAKIAALVISIAAMAPAYAGSKDIRELAEYTGLTERKVQMILGCHSCYAEYRHNYQRSLKQFKQALGEENFEQLMAGRPVTLDNGIEVRVASVD